MSLVTKEQYEEYLAHHGVQGMKWGVRRYQDANGKLTAEGRERYAKNIQRGEEEFKKGNTIEKEKAAAKKDQRIQFALAAGHAATVSALTIAAPPVAAGVAVVGAAGLATRQWITRIEHYTKIANMTLAEKAKK